MILHAPLVAIFGLAILAMATNTPQAVVTTSPIEPLFVAAAR
ncbi:hypothetical protein OE810_12305 [Rhodobacteraceae bacterium XHP0102]|nr:hypothetical protein [Rhodobacteraceae bacterium XHP0102]